MICVRSYPSSARFFRNIIIGGLVTSFEKPLPLGQSWLAYLHQQGHTPHTLNTYRRAWQHLAQWYEGSYGEPCDPPSLIARKEE